jgi:hypothetical protein
MVNELYQQIKVCTACKGWGRITEKEMCSVCGGKGVYIQNNQEIAFFGLPDFMDYSFRAKVKFIKFGLSFFIGIALIILLLIILT